MFGINYIKFDSMTYAIHYAHGNVKREGRGLAFFYYSPTSSITAVPLGSKDILFIFNETTKDFQTITIQGQITYAIENPKQLSEMLDFTLDDGRKLNEANFEKLSQRLNNEAQTATSSFIQSIGLKETLRSAREISDRIKAGLEQSDAVKLLGVSILSVDVLAVRPTPEMAKALETEMRESLQREADQAIYERRNFAVEQERMISESELNTEIAVQEKRKQINEKQAEIKVKEAENARRLREMTVAADLSVEEQRTKLIEMQVENERKVADAKGYTLEKTLTPYKQMDWRTLMAINSKGISAIDNIGFAFRELAENSSKIGTLNITPDLLDTVIKNQRSK
ncbi:SPFH domain-containing protein [Chryseolinea soli]|uniref:Membrane protease subunit, stomatin/prohibitin n=1 Tax=Chryseolinea soli TaxID=2321403 RepID=A0A385SKN4_9BACT|nr:SPFH domain-containing protein [Chryseolinea soli]AYB30921.1 membrane protease subunit, stomatin/prohibitin [Chryseolinea soli]